MLSGHLAHPRPHRAGAPLLALLAALLVLSSLPFARRDSFVRPAPPVAPARIAPMEAAAPQPGAMTSAPALFGKPEVVERREEYARHYDLGGGRYLAAVGLEPLNYRDAGGAWRPLNVAFASKADGWQVVENSLRSELPERGTAVQLAGDGGLVGWQPRALAVRGAGDTTRDLATPLAPEQAAPGERAADGRSLRYAHAWSDTTLVEQFHSRVGALKQELVLASRPALGAGAAWLELRVDLQLPADAVVFADGRAQAGDVTTAGALDLRNATGAPLLTLLPPLAYEQAGQARVAGRYRLLRRPGTATLLVQTPAAWWADPARHYPAVLDPTMQVLHMQVEGAGIYHQQGSTPIWSHIPPSLPLHTFQIGNICVGHANPVNVPGLERGYVRFPHLPSLPRGAQPSDARLVGTPIPAFEYGLTPLAFEADGLARQPIEARGLLEPWIGSTKLPKNYKDLADDGAANTNMIERLDTSDRALEYGDLPATLWDVTSTVQRWYSDPTQNHGFVLKLSEGAEVYAGVGQTLPGGYGGRAFNSCFPTYPTWSTLDDVVTKPTDPTTKGAGLGLLVSYEAPDADSFYSEAGPSSFPPNSYKDQYHEYRLAATTMWRVVAAQDIREAGTANKSKTPLTLVEAGGKELFRSDAGSAAPDNKDMVWQPNYIVINGHKPLPNDLRVRVLPDAAASTNSSHTFALDDAPASPRLPSSGSVSFDLDIDDDLTDVQELALAANTTVEIVVPYSDKERPADFNVQLFQPSTTYASRTVAGAELTRGPEGYEIEFSVAPGEQGPWLLVVNSNREAHEQFESTGRVTVCPNTAAVVRYPVEGKCVELQRPPPGFTADSSRYRQVGSGNVRVYSPSGFLCSPICTTRTAGANGVPTMPLIGYAGDDHHWVALKSGALTINANTVTTPYGTRLMLVDFANPATIHSLPVLRGEFKVDGATGLLTAVSAPARTNVLVKSPMHAQDDNEGVGDKYGWRYEINLQTDHLRALGLIKRAIQPTQGEAIQTFNFNAEWSIDVRGGPSLQGKIALNGSPPTQFAVGALLYTPPASGYMLESNPSEVAASTGAAIPQFHQIRMVNGRLAQPESLGGAHLFNQQAMLRWPGVSVLDADGAQVELTCGATCFDLRGPADSVAKIDRVYHMPDLVIQDQANTALLNTAGGVDVYSSDHPQATLDAAELDFSFEAFEASVRTFRGPCPSVDDGQGATTTIITGTAKLALPAINADGNQDAPGAYIAGSFVLCETSLRTVHIELNTGPEVAIPLKPTPLYLNFLGGTVDIIPSKGSASGYTTVVLDVQLRASKASAQGSTVFTNGTLTLDTRGLFDLQARTSVKVFAGVGAGLDGNFWVSWSPLDLGFDVQGCAPYTGSFDPKDFPIDPPGLCDEDKLLLGTLRAHVWQGQGFQQQYHWLPDDDALHVAARFTARLKLKAGLLVDWGPVQVPPDDIILEQITLAFGEFCTDDACATWEWGVMGNMQVFGYDVGVYYGFSSGVNFILGSNGYTLIDEAGAVTGAAASVGVRAQPDGTTTRTITVAPGTPSVMFGLAWTGATPQLALREPGPGGRTITKNELYTDVHTRYGATKQGSNQHLVVITDPKPGPWQVDLVAASGRSSARFFHFANDPPPTLTLSVAGNPAPNARSLQVQWTNAPVARDSQARLSLYYEATSATAPLRDNQRLAGPIIERIPLTASGSATWNIAGLPSGAYKIYARIDNNAGVVVASCRQASRPSSRTPVEVYNPDPTKQRCGTMLNPALMLSQERIDATARVSLINDAAPAAPTGVAVRVEGLASVALRWQPNAEADVAGYIVACAQGRTVRRAVRVVARRQRGSSLKETARVNGLVPDQPATCEVQAYDVDLNTGPASPSVVVTPGVALPAPLAAPGDLRVAQQRVTVTLSWTPVRGAAGYLVYYEPLLGDGTLTGGYRAREGASPLDVGNQSSVTLTGLRLGVEYKFWVRPYDRDERAGARTPTRTLTVVAQHQLFLPAILR